MNKEVHYEGWLIKSPPSKRIWRSRWRRRWFTLKQGEIPEQFCLEYYTDRNCRKLKGIIDLDQCEQVDCGLRLENRKQKFQFMFDIKTPKRTYYLAADSVEDMRYWVNCICQVCHLHDTKHSMEEYDRMRTSGNINPNSTPASSITQAVVNTYNKEINNHRHLFRVSSTTTEKCDNVYQNNESAYVNAKYGNRELLNYPTSDANHPKNNECQDLKMGNTNTNPDEKTYFDTSLLPNENNSEHRIGALRKIPGNLILQSSPSFDIQPSPFVNSSGPYIPISECFSGTPKHLENPTTPLNNLDPKFYDTPRSHNNIGLNLTNDQSYSPKISNCTGEVQITDTKNYTTPNGRSDSDSEEVFTDDDEWTYPMPLRENIDRTARPSDSSVENESFVLTYSQRFSKLPDEVSEKVNNIKSNTDNDYKSKNKPYEMVKLNKYKGNLSLDIRENQKVSHFPQLSDTENTSPAIGPHDASSIVEVSYDIPRSHQLPYHNLEEMFKEQIWSNTSMDSSKSLLSLDDISDFSKTDSQATLQKHFYTNAAPNKLEGHVFRYDFIEQADFPPVNRKLKPKSSNAGKLIGELADATLNNPITEESFTLRPPSVDRNLKPNIYKVENSSFLENVFMRSMDVKNSMKIPAETDKYILETQTLPRSVFNQSIGPADATISHQRSLSVNHASVKIIPTSKNVKDQPRLQYFDLDLSNPPTVNRQSININNLTKSKSKKIDSSVQDSLKSGVVYNSVDFVKTEAFKRIREEREKESENVNYDVKMNK